MSNSTLLQEEEAASLQTRINELYQSFLDQKETVNDELHQALQQLFTLPPAYLEVSSYLHLLYMYGKYYDRIENKNGARYCAMRMLWMKECLENKRKRNSRLIKLVPYAFSDTEVSFMQKYTDFIQQIYRDINKKLLILTVALILIVFAILAFALQISYGLAILEAAILGGINFFLQKRRMPDMFQKNQTEASAKYIEEDLFDFDRTYRFS